MSGRVDAYKQLQDWYEMKEKNLLYKLFVSGKNIILPETLIRKNVLLWLKKCEN